MTHKTKDPSDTEIEKLLRIKCDLLTKGVRFDSSLENLKNPLRTRSGVSGGLDVRLPFEVFVNAPTNEEFARHTPLSIVREENNLILRDGHNPISNISVLPAPKYYSEVTSDGDIPLSHIGQLCSADRFCYGMTGPACFFWKEENRCRYCSISKNYQEDAARKKANHLLEALRAATKEREYPARHVLLGGGTPRGEDMGAKLAAELCHQVKAVFPNISVYVMIAAPLSNSWLDLLKEAGADEVGLNLEFWHDDSWKNYIPGKRAAIGKKRYLEALEYAAELFGPINTRSIVIAGLEPAEETLNAIAALSSRGVMPIISPFRPLDGTMLHHVHGFSTDEYIDLFWRATDCTNATDIPLGPTCKCCQNNTLALPFGKHYRNY